MKNGRRWPDRGADKGRETMTKIAFIGLGNMGG
ncbi:MAG: 3-hydroxyisobutyrate dehydrogenase, partial [Brevundimonas sp.]